MKKLIIKNDFEEKEYNVDNCEIFFSSDQNVLQIKFITEKNIIKYVMHSDMGIKSIYTLLKLVSDQISKNEVFLRDYQERDYVFLKGEECEIRITAQKYIEDIV